jgi:hypothetical protein
VPTKKQRRRRQKTRRHDWEYVYVDEEGHEVEVDPAELRPAKKSEERPKKATATSSAGAARARTGRAIEPPSWRRVGRRALLMAPIFIAAMMLLNRNLPVAQRIAPAVFLLLFFIPFSYFTDSLAYRMYRKRVERQDAPKGSGSPKAKTR